MDELDRDIIRIMRGNARISFQELGNKLGMTRVGAKKRVRKLEDEGIIRGYNTCIYEPGMMIVLIDIITKPETFEDILKYISTRMAWIRQIYTTAKENHIHIVATPCSVRDYNYLVRMITKRCSKDAEEILTLNQGTGVEVLLRGENWTIVKYRDQVGYVMSRYLQFP